MRGLLISFSDKKNILFLSLVAYLPISRAVLFVRDTTNRSLEDYAAVDLQNSINILATAIMLTVAVRPRARFSGLWLLRGPTRWLVVYLIFCLLSCVWAVNPMYAAYQAVELIAVLFFMGYILATIGDPRDGILYLCRFAAATALLPYVAEVVRSGAIFQHTNAYSTCGAFGAAMALSAVKRGVFRLADVKYSLAACLAGVIFGTSSASNVALLVGVLLIVVTSKRHAVSLARLGILAAIMFLVLTRGIDVVRPYIFPGKDVDQIKSMRGRTVVYAAIWDAFEKSPIIGYGFASGERSIDIDGMGITSSAHNGALSVAVNTGIVGFVLFALGFYYVMRSLYLADLNGDRFAWPVFVAIVVGLINSMAYPVVGSTWKYPTTAFLGVVAYVSVFVAPGYGAPQEEYLPEC
jgi:O-antigen ligase